MKFKPILFAFTVIFLSGCSNNDNSSSGSLNDTISDEKPTLLPYDIDKTGSINRFYANDENSENIVIPSTYSIDGEGRIITGNAYEIKTISEFCFANNSLIKTIYIPDTIETIKSSAFYNCANLEKIIIPSSVSFLDVSAFERCPKLVTLSGVETSGNLILHENDNLTEFEFPDSITTIDYQAFDGWDKLESLSFGENITKISGGSVKNCALITSVTIKGVLSELGDGVFSDCPNLTNLSFEAIPTIKKFVLPESIDTIPDYMFYNWTSLEELYLHENTKINRCVLNNNYSLRKVSCSYISLLELFSYGEYPVSTEESEDFYVVQWRKDTNSYTRYSHIPKTLDEVEFIESTTGIASYCLYSMESIKTIRIPSSVTYFGLGSFSGLEGLEKVYFSTNYDWEYANDNSYSSYSGTISKSTMNSPDSLATAIKNQFRYDCYWRAKKK